MKKTRNTFFQESNYQTYNPNMNQGPYQQASNYFYSGPMPNNYNTSNSNYDIESRISKLERQVNKLEYRINKLENVNNISSSTDFDNNSNMYMV